VRELRAGLWHWQAPHPAWGPSEPWDQNVSSYATDDGERPLLFDPIALPSEIETLATERETAVVLTAPWHERDAQGLVERLGVPDRLALAPFARSAAGPTQGRSRKCCFASPSARRRPRAEGGTPQSPARSGG
jgi:hypothetical protein